MKVESNHEDDYAYIGLVPRIRPGGVRRALEVTDSINLDLGHDGKLLGMEVSSVTRLLRDETLRLAGKKAL